MFATRVNGEHPVEGFRKGHGTPNYLTRFERKHGQFRTVRAIKKFFLPKDTDMGNVLRQTGRFHFDGTRGMYEGRWAPNGSSLRWEAIIQWSARSPDLVSVPVTRFGILSCTDEERWPNTSFLTPDDIPLWNVRRRLENRITEIDTADTFACFRNKWMWPECPYEAFR